MALSWFHRGWLRVGTAAPDGGIAAIDDSTAASVSVLSVVRVVGKVVLFCVRYNKALAAGAALCRCPVLLNDVSVSKVQGGPFPGRQARVACGRRVDRVVVVDTGGDARARITTAGVGAAGGGGHWRWRDARE